MSLIDAPAFEVLESARSVLVAGAGGGFDVFCGVPIAIALRRLGKDVTFANLSFTYFGDTDATQLEPALYRVTPATAGAEHYFPERLLAQWLAKRGESSAVYGLDKVGVRPTRAAYARIVAEHAIDAIVLVDGGTDLLMRGDEAGLGTPAEDMTSLAAIAGVDVPIRVATCLGFGIDAHHGVCHAQFLENVARLARAGGYLGAVSLRREDPGGAAYLDLVAFANERTPRRESIVNACIASAVEGQFGDHHATGRTHGSTLFINPLMSLYWSFDLLQVARENLYLDRIEASETVWDVQVQVEAFRKGAKIRPRSAISG
jgi:hypothetical protein